MPHFIFIQQISVLNILNMLDNLHFFSSKCCLFHNATLFGFCITHILNTGCAKFKKKSVARRLNRWTGHLPNTRQKRYRINQLIPCQYVTTHSWKKQWQGCWVPQQNIPQQHPTVLSHLLIHMTFVTHTDLPLQNTRGCCHIPGVTEQHGFVWNS